MRMAKLQNIHSHTVYCDGTQTLEEMVIAAIEKGCDSFGFSGHSYAPFDAKHCMSPENTHKYILEIKKLNEKYAEQIELFAGIEQEYLGENVREDVDFIIGSVHYIRKGDVLICIDGGEKAQKIECDTNYGGDYYAFAEDYFATAANVAVKTNADIIGHFDLIAKYNFGGKLFDEANPRYVGAALEAMDEILKNHKLFEVNTGAMFRFDKPEPYPSVFLLKELFKRGGEVILSSDSHHAESICYKFNEMRELIKSCGFRYMKQLTRDGFVAVPC